MFGKIRAFIDKADLWLDLYPGWIILGVATAFMTGALAVITWPPFRARPPDCDAAIAGLDRDFTQNDADLSAGSGDRTDALCPVLARRVGLMERADKLRTQCGGRFGHGQFEAEFAFYRRLADERCARRGVSPAD